MLLVLLALPVRTEPLALLDRKATRALLATQAQLDPLVLMARLAPPDMTTEMFGLFALSGKVTAFMGPALVAVVTNAFDSQRIGMTPILGFFLVGMLLMLLVKEPRE